MIYVIGDSHVSVFSGVEYTPDGYLHIQPEFGTCYTLSSGKLKCKINNFEQKISQFCAIKVGSFTAYNSYNKLPIIENAINEYKINIGDYIFLCFGQIDIQNHLIPNSIKDNITINKAIEICVERYMKTILYLKKNYTNIKFGVYGAVATSIGCGRNPRIGVEEAKKFNTITLDFNKSLKDLCLKNNILYRDISNYLILPDGRTDDSMVLDDIHLSQKAMPFILKEFKNLF